MTIKDNRGNILKPTDIIKIKTRKGDKKLKIVSFSGRDIIATTLNEGKKFTLKSNQRKNIELYNINDTFAKSDNVIAPYIDNILSEIKETSQDDFRTNSPVISLQEMTNFGISVKGHMTADEKLEYNKRKITRLLNEAKTLTRDYSELKHVTTQLNNIVKILK